jgi:hypothetical protein
MTARLLLFLIALLIAPFLPVRAPQPSDAAETEARHVIADYHTDDPMKAVLEWQRLMPKPSRDPRFKEYQAQRLKEWNASEFAPYRVSDPALASSVRAVFEPVLRLYDRQDCFEIIVIDHPVPVMMNDSGVLLMVSTGMLERTRGDEEILGYVAHELGHDLHWNRTAAARETVTRERAHGSLDSPAAKRALGELASIELECDAFSAVTLAALGMNPAPFGLYLKATARDFPAYLDPNMPPMSIREKVIAGVTPIGVRGRCPHVSEALNRLKTLLAKRGGRHDRPG